MADDNPARAHGPHKPDHDFDEREKDPLIESDNAQTDDYTDDEEDAIKSDMTEQNQTQTDGAQTFEQRVAMNYDGGSDGDFLADQTAHRFGVHKYHVESTRSGTVSVHTVDTKELTCTCEAFKHNAGENDVCAHIAYILTVEDGVNLDDLIAQDASYVMHMADSAMSMAERAGTQDATQTTDRADQSQHEATEDTTEDTDDEPSEEVRLAAGKLDNAFEAAGIDDMQIVAKAGHVWFKTGQDTQETIETDVGPDLNVHEWLIQDPDAVKWVHDGSQDWANSPHSLHDDKPGEYYTNALEPEDVDNYINEVLD